MHRKRRTVTLIIFFFCFLLVAYAVYQMYEILNSSVNILDASYSPPTNNLNKKESVTTGHVILQWDPVPKAKAYNIYWSTNPGVSKSNGNKIENVTNPTTIKDLKAKTTYYFVVTAVSEIGESETSKEISYTISQ